MSTWTIGNVVVIFLAGLQSVPRSLYEAAQIDGGGGWAQFRHVTLPMISPVLLFNLVMGIIFSFQVFTSAFLMTQGGPANTTLFTVLYLYQVAFEQFKVGLRLGDCLGPVPGDPGLHADPVEARRLLGLLRGEAMTAGQLTVRSGWRPGQHAAGLTARKLGRSAS